MGVARILPRGQPDNFYSWQLTPKHALRLTARAERTVRTAAGVVYVADILAEQFASVARSIS
jgi:hypothetical protein